MTEVRARSLGAARWFCDLRGPARVRGESRGAALWARDWVLKNRRIRAGCVIVIHRLVVRGRMMLG